MKAQNMRMLIGMQTIKIALMRFHVKMRAVLPVSPEVTFLTIDKEFRCIVFLLQDHRAWRLKVWDYFFW